MNAVTLVTGLSAAVTVLASVPVIAGTIRRRAQPQVMSWAVWAILLGTGGAAALEAGQLPAAVYTLSCAAECALVAALALRIPAAGRAPAVRLRLPGAVRVRLDRVCMCGAAAGLVLLAVVRAPGLSVSVAVLTDLVAYVPTMVSGWRNPHGEAVLGYGLYAVGAGLALAVADLRSLTAVAYPAYLLLADTAVTVMIGARRGFHGGRVSGRHVLPRPGAGGSREPRARHRRV